MGERIGVLELRSVRGTGGGPEKTILLGADRRDRERFDVTVCYIRDARDEIFGIGDRAAALDIDYAEVRERHSFDVRIWRALKNLIADRRIAIVHAHEYKTDLLAWLLARRLPVAALATVHGWTGHTPRERTIYYPFDKKLLSRFPRVIAVSSEIRNELLRTGSRPARVEVILNAIDATAYRRVGRRREARRDLGLDETAVVIGAVGRLEPQKRFDLLMEAVQPILASRPDTHLVIAGDGSARALLTARMAALGIEAQSHLVGHRQDVTNLHETFDVFVQSSDYEGTPNAVLEAMAMETPIVATDAGGTAELAVHDLHALIVPIQNVPALTDAVRRTLSEPEAARRRAIAARTRVERELSFEARTRRLERIYSELVHA